MILVDRNTVPPPRILTDMKAAGAKETAAAIAYFSAIPRSSTSKSKTNRGKSKSPKGNPKKPAGKNSKAKRPGPPRYSVYSKPEVKQALEAIFHGKCAYCEHAYDAGSPGDVEHFRPKGRIDIGDGTVISPGYYWLAAEWTNLLSSCTDCNRERKQIEKPSMRERKSGKIDYFPLLDETKRAQKKGEEGNEQPLLLNPCDPKDDPQLFLEFYEENRPNGGKQVALIRAKPDAATKTPNVRGQGTVDIFGLNRKGLVQDRERWLKQAIGKIADLQQYETLLNNTTGAAKAQVRALMETKMTELRDLRDSQAPYSALIRQYVDPIIQRQAGVAPPN